MYPQKNLEPLKLKPCKPKPKKIRIKFSSQSSLHNMLLTLRKNKVKFLTEDTSGSFKIRVLDVKTNTEKIYEYNSPGDLMAMGVYMKLRKEILSRPVLDIKPYSPRDLKYWGLNNKGFGKKTLKRVTNIDVKKAYPFAFFSLGFIGKDVLNYLLELDKKGKKLSRLKGMGILAKQKVVNNYNNGRLINFKIKQDVYLRSCFFNACKIIDDLMLKCVKTCGKDFLFFWVDGIYVDTSTKRGRNACKRICNLIKKEGYKYSREILRDFKTDLAKRDLGDKIKIKINKEVLNISFRKKNSRGKYSRKPKTFSLPLNHGIQERLS